MSPDMVTALGGIILGLAPIAAGLIGKRGADAARNNAPPGAASADPAAGLTALVEQLQEERDKAHATLVEIERALREAYTQLAAARAEAGELRARIVQLHEERAAMRQAIVDLGGFPP